MCIIFFYNFNLLFFRSYYLGRIILTVYNRVFEFYSLQVTTSIYPVPSICAQDQISDWFDSLAECLHWNVRKRQKHFEELSDLAHSKYEDSLDSTSKDTLLATGKYQLHLIVLNNSFNFELFPD